jgi:hypothetical protein
MNGKLPLFATGGQANAAILGVFSVSLKNIFRHIRPLVWDFSLPGKGQPDDQKFPQFSEPAGENDNDDE